MSRTGKGTETEGSSVVIRGRGAGDRGWPLNGKKISSWGDGNVPELDGGDHCTALAIY